MAKIIGQIQKEEIKARIKHSKKIRHHKGLKVDFGALLKEAINASKK